jgi:hypothetical protein
MELMGGGGPEADEAPSEIRLDVPLVRQGPNCGCGIAAICMAMNYHGHRVSIRELERHRLLWPRMLARDGIGPGRLGRIVLAHGFGVTIVDPVARDVGKLFVAEGGDWVAEPPTRRHIVEWLAGGHPVVACIPDKTLAFEGCTHHGSHWVTIHSLVDGDFLIHDPAPWRKATRCKPGYWNLWSCSLIVVRPSL